MSSNAPNVPASQEPPVDAFARLRSRPDAFLAQLEEAESADVEGISNLKDLPQLIWLARTFVLEAHVSKKQSKGRRSWIARHGIFLTEIGVTGAVKQAIWACNICISRGRPQFFNCQSTSSPIRHLAESHHVTEHTEDPVQTLTVLDIQKEASSKRPLRAVIPKHRASRLRDLAAGYIIHSSLPFTAFQDPYLRALLAEFNAPLLDEISLQRTAIASNIDKIFQISKETVKQQLRDSSTKIHISFDLWTSPNHLAMLAVIGHFLDPEYKQQTRLLALKEHIGAHDGVNIADSIDEVIRDWGIQEKIGVAVADNASNNDTCIQSLFPRLMPDLHTGDIKHLRMRCFGHILNLVAKAFLYGEDEDAFELEADDIERREAYDAALSHWRRKGAVGKIHNIIRYVQASPQRREAFRKASRDDDAAGNPDSLVLIEPTAAELELKQNNATRWNSTYLMIRRALKKQSHIEKYVATHHIDANGPVIPQEDRLAIEDWRVLSEIQFALKPIYDMTMWLQGNGSGQLCDIQPGIEYLLEHLEDLKALYLPETADVIADTASILERPGSRRSSRQQRHPNDTRLPRHVRDDWANFNLALLDEDGRQYMRASINNAWAKLNTYYDLLSESPLFAASNILHPGRGIGWQERCWASREDWLGTAKRELRIFFERWYPRDTPDAIPDPPRQRENRQKEEEDPTYVQWVNAFKPKDDELEDELERYYRQKLQNVDDPFQWHSLTAEKIEKIQLLKHWIMERAIRIGNIDI